MKVLENKVTSIPIIDEKGKNTGLVDFSKLLTMCINQIPQGGANAKEMRENFRIFDVIEKEGKDFSFEDADILIIKSRVSSMKWGFQHRDLIDFIDTIESL